MQANERDRAERKARANLETTVLRNLGFILSTKKH